MGSFSSPDLDRPIRHGGVRSLLANSAHPDQTAPETGLQFLLLKLACKLMTKAPK